MVLNIVAMKIYDIRRCSIAEYPLLVQFIKQYWREDHIFVKSKELFDFQHYNPLTKDYNFLIGWNTETNEIDGIIGLIPVSQYDPELCVNKETWSGIWKVRDDVKNQEIGLLGLDLYEHFYKMKLHVNCGLSSIAVKMNKLMRYKIGEMSQYFILNEAVSDFKIAKLSSDYNRVTNTEESDKYFIREILNEEQLFFCNKIVPKYHPIKSINYIYNRFLKHPIYKYQIWGVYNDADDLILIWVTRKISINNSSVLRIVDALGDIESINTSLYKDFQKMMQQTSSEYIDFINYGIAESFIKVLGFEKLDLRVDIIIIPEYFEPFLQENRVLNYSYRYKGENIAIFKGDADQDRPNIMPTINE